MSLKNSDYLSAAADLLAKPGAWTQGSYARNAEGVEVPSNDAAATCWCLLGAADRVDMPGRTVGVLYAHIIRVVPHGGALLYNDAPERTQTEVVDLLRTLAAQELEAGR